MFDLFGLSVICVYTSLTPCRNCQLKPREYYENKSTKSLICKIIIYRKKNVLQTKEGDRETQKKENRGQINICIYIYMYKLFGGLRLFSFLVQLRHICICVCRL